MQQKRDLIGRAIDFLESEARYFGDFRIDFEVNESDQHISDTNVEAKTSEEATSQKNNSEHTASTTEKSFETETGSDIQKPTVAQKNKSGTNPGTADPLAACSTLEELKKLCIDNKALKTDLKNTNLVFGVGDPHADLMIIGEAPGFNEDKQGEPFVGKAGQLLNKILDAIGFQRSHVYIANILKHRPPNNRNPSAEERQRSLPYLKRQIELVNPKLILCLGKVSANTLLDNSKSLSSMRGTFHPFMDDIELMVTYHPAALLRNEQWKRPTWEDVQKLRKRYDHHMAG